MKTIFLNLATGIFISVAEESSKPDLTNDETAEVL
jgi:hypothetical protein